MKLYTGLNAKGAWTTHVTVRTPGIKEIPMLAKHFKGDFQWGIECNESKELAKSLLLDAFGTTTCRLKKCKCQNDWITTNHIDSFHEKIVMEWISDETFKITQGAICDFVFDTTNIYNKLEAEIDEIKVSEVV